MGLSSLYFPTPLCFSRGGLGRRHRGGGSLFGSCLFGWQIHRRIQKRGLPDQLVCIARA